MNDFFAWRHRLFIASTSNLSAAEPLVALNNLAHEFAICAAYFGVVSIALENSKDAATSDEYELLMEHALEYAATTGEGIGLLPETTGARFDTAIEEMRTKIGGNTSNISILFRDHMDACTAAMEDPGGRIEHWLTQ